MDLVKRSLSTARLQLRPTRPVDADRAVEIQSDWSVGRMLRMARFPPDLEQTRRWFEDHERERLCGEAYRFAVELGHRFVGVVDIDEIGSGWGDIGYWFERGALGMGYATEAAHAVVQFAFDDVQLEGLLPATRGTTQRQVKCS